MNSIEISEAQALAFRGRRHHLIGPGAPSPAMAAKAVVGIQAQVLAPALWSLSLRTADRPTADSLGQALLTSPDLTRTWGQRDTVHIYDTQAHWNAIVTGLRVWPISQRGGLQPDASSIEAAEAKIRSLGRPVTRSDLFDLLPDDFVEYMATRVGPGVPALRGTAGRMIWDLSRRGLLSAHEMVNREQSYVLREHRYPDLQWPELQEAQVAHRLVVDYLAANAPATVQDIAHFLGTRVSQARALVAPLEAKLVEVVCGSRKGLLALEKDSTTLSAPPPKEWTPRLLPKFDTLLMSHKDKDWTVPEASDRPQIWAKAAQVRATVWHKGKLLAIWTHKAQKRRVKIEITPLSGWIPGLEAQLNDDGAAFASHLGVPEASITLKA